MMPFPMIADVVASVRCSCPTLVLLRWDVGMLSLDLLVVDDNASHTLYVDAATFFLVDELDELDDALTDQADVLALFLYDVVEHILL